MASIFKKMTKILFSSFDQSALMEGISDIIVVKWDSGEYFSTPFLVCFGCLSSLSDSKKIKVYVNDCLINNADFTLDQYGYLHPLQPGRELLQRLNLREHRNAIKFELDQLDNQHSISSEIYLFDEHDKLLISDMDGTLTKSDACGIYSNYQNRNYLHDGYHELIQKAYKNGYKIVWLTMRSLPLYKFSKQYVRNHTSMHGVLIMQPQQFFPAAKKQLMKKTGNIKTNMLMTIRSLFPQSVNPFIGGLGNRQNDAIAYRAAGIPLQNIFLVDPHSKVHHLSNNKQCISYNHMNKQIHEYFPKLSQKCLMKDLFLSVDRKSSSKKQQVKLYRNAIFKQII